MILQTSYIHGFKASIIQLIEGICNNLLVIKLVMVNTANLLEIEINHQKKCY